MNKQEIQNKDIRLAIANLKKIINQNYSPSFFSEGKDIFGTIGEFIIVCLYLIFRPLNIIAIGIIIIVLFLLL